MSDLLNLEFILIADDDEDDRLLLIEAFKEHKLDCKFHVADNGSDAVDYLARKGAYKDHLHDAPDLIILDINMPKKNGKEVLIHIKEDPTLKHIPVIIFTTSKVPDDVKEYYALGASSYIVKPNSFDGLLAVTSSIRKYWFETVSLKKLMDNY